VPLKEVPATGHRESVRFSKCSTPFKGGLQQAGCILTAGSSTCCSHGLLLRHTCPAESRGKGCSVLGQYGAVGAMQPHTKAPSKAGRREEGQQHWVGVAEFVQLVPHLGTTGRVRCSESALPLESHPPTFPSPVAPISHTMGGCCFRAET
jgi:hypothetical protein